jgi:hypothetical protein
MKRTTLHLLWLLVGLAGALSPSYGLACSTPIDTSEWVVLTSEELLAIKAQQRQYQQQQQALLLELQELARLLDDTDPGMNTGTYLRALQKQRILEKELSAIRVQQELQLLKTRYRKGIELIKILYEKILALDHHFSGMQTYQNILLISNPNTYPEFQKARTQLEERLKKRNSLQLPGILSSNPYLSATFSLVAAVVGDGESRDKQESFDQISCILDFTVRMNSDLSIIQHETEYLKKANQELKQECERLFEDYVKVVRYLVPLDVCRRNDDWETLHVQLNEFMRQLEQQLQNDPSLLNSSLQRDQINLEFATQRVADFISQYSRFITLGVQYYQKFNNIVSTYEHERACQSQLPRQFGELQTDIQGTIEKFNNTYRLPEIQGSRLKDLLHGVADR